MRTYTFPLAILALIAVGCHGSTKTVTRSRIPVRTIVITESSADTSSRYTANVKAKSNVPVIFRVGGYVVDAGDQTSLLEPGDPVTKGQVLARVRQADYLATQQQAEAGVSSAKAQLFQARSKLTEATAVYAQSIAGIEEARAKRQSAVAQVEEAQHAVRQAQGGLEEANAGREQAGAALQQAQAGNAKARADFARAKSLLAVRAATQAEFDAAKAQLDASDAQVAQAEDATRSVDAKQKQARSLIAQARNKVEQARGQVRAADAAITRLGESRNAANAAVSEAHGLVGQASAGVNGASAQRTTAGLALQDSALTSPITGVVVMRKIELGALVGPGAPGFVLADTRKMKVTFSVPTSDSTFRIGARVPFRVDGVTTTFYGVVSTVATSADPTTRLFDVELSVDNTNGKLKQGMLATVFGASARQAPTVRVPLSTLVGGDAPSVFVVIDSTLKKVPVKLGLIRGDRVEVLSGLKPGDVVVSAGGGMLSEGDAVEVVYE